jgi:hypothetical protein
VAEGLPTDEAWIGRITGLDGRVAGHARERLAVFLAAFELGVERSQPVGVSSDSVDGAGWSVTQRLSR